MDLTREVKQIFLKIARSAIRSALEDKPLPDLDYKHEVLEHNSSVFVTLRMDENLRGCIGYAEPVHPL